MTRTVVDSPSPGSFARNLLHSEVIASRYLVDTSQDDLVISDYENCGVQTGYGGWPEYSGAEVDSEQPLKQTQYSGRRADSMSRQEIIVDGTPKEAFVTDYRGGNPNTRQAQSQMTVWAFCDALGLNVPKHHWFPSNETVVVAEVGGPDETVVDPISIEPSVADHIDPDALMDYISVLLLAGTADLLPKNFKIGEEGQIYVFDFDKADQRFESIRVLKHACTKAMKTVNVLNTVRDEDLPIDRDGICTRVQEIATEINSSPHLNRILGTVELYDDLFIDETSESFEDLFRNNITVFARTGA
jgi:hypothetical protein